MARVKLQLPANFSFVCQIPIRITDINYGGHVGNDTILTIIHEARMQYLSSLGYSEMNFGGTGMIMTDVTIEFKSELFYGDIVLASVTAGEISKIGFDIFYKLEKETSGNKLTVANAKTAMICYDYEKKKIVAVPEEAGKKLAMSNTQ
jgi:acyl-CoA thioester hydrolase